MKKLILALVVMLLCGLSVALESSEKKDTIEGLKNALSTLDQYDFSVPVGIGHVLTDFSCPLTTITHAREEAEKK
ncbi:MAG: hypothetical protein UU82_C0004G0019 [Candidatus Nomurabacteria bacterium GW2011_GWC2_41_8]|uniref:Uncharacterized protein n=1 Tax=Candidatus Nomurabacteria bacterium GW2011_GWC2_41_8 TaxID=1618755 RepID=A0A0G0XI05_9BACT|nr:MAG: hypothetical protein UU82_C0004G0019 [Candidatus Nomurabacteria bacterium GW2011_GWC2_41_8]